MKKLIAAPKVAICDECVRLSQDILDEEALAALPPPPESVNQLHGPLDRAVVGQPAATRAVAVALFRHLRGLSPKDKAPASRSPRLLLIGPRGNGKSTLARALCAAELSGLPAYHADASALSETGYVGENVENLFGALLGRAPNDEVGRRGLLVLDGLHHLVRQRPPEGTRDVSGREVQRDLVRLLDGLSLQPTRGGPRHPMNPQPLVPADRLFVIALATFEVEADDEQGLRARLRAAGLVDELLSRFDRIVLMPRLDTPSLRQVLQRALAELSAELAPLGVPIEAAGGEERLIAAALASPDGAFALQPPLARLAERALLEAPRRWALDDALAEGLLQREPPVEG